MGYRHNTEQDKTIANATSDTLTHAHTLVTSVCAAAAAGVDTSEETAAGSRSIRKKCNRVILIAFAAAMLAVCISPALASATYIPPDPTDLTNTTGRYWVNYTWQAGSGWYLIAGDAGGGFHGYNWTGSAWQSDSAIASDLPDVGNYSAPTVFQKGEEWYLIAGEMGGGFCGYNWTGSAWQDDSVIASGLTGGGNYSAPTVFQKGGDWYLIAGEAGGGFNGYNWTGSAWQSNSVIVSDLPDSGGPDVRDHSAPTVFQKDGFWYLISGEMDGGFYGYNWTDSAWQSDSAIVNGLLDASNYSAPAVFQKDGGWYLIAGEAGGGFYGYKWTDSAWQSDSAIASGLLDVEDNSTPAVFDMGSNVTDSYNISINGTWHNGTTNTSINETVGPDVWVNITIWAWNASGTGTLSAVCVSDNAQAWAEPDSTFGLVGSVPTGSGTYPPGWFETPTPAVSATKAPAASTTGTATAAPPGERVTPTPVPTKRPAATKMAAPAAEGAAAETTKKDVPGFTAVFVIAGMLAIAYAMMRRQS